MANQMAKLPKICLLMAQDFIIRTRGSEKPQLIGEILKNYFETSNEPLAIAFRKRMVAKAFAEKGDKE